MPQVLSSTLLCPNRYSHNKSCTFSFVLFYKKKKVYKNINLSLFIHIEIDFAPVGKKWNPIIMVDLKYTNNLFLKKSNSLGQSPIIHILEVKLLCFLDMLLWLRL